MAKDLIRLMNALFLPAAGAICETCWRPAADIYRRANEWLVKVDLAGVRPEDVSLSVQGHSLIVRGCRRDWIAKEGHSHYHMEIAYSHFERRLELPCDLETARITTESREGMLLIRIQPETQS
jgi:HSP20 family protein